ncbi:MAG: hypothetical protein LBS60_04365 [Deltaproteobacteria bacterium]|nr:hypothetical protein [Deltaproteobacteria bacterium]
MSNVSLNPRPIRWAPERSLNHLTLLFIGVGLALTLLIGQAGASTWPLTIYTPTGIQNLINGASAGDIIKFQANSNIDYNNPSFSIALWANKNNLTISGYSNSNFGATVDPIVQSLVNLGQSITTGVINSSVSSLTFPTTTSSMTRGDPITANNSASNNDLENAKLIQIRNNGLNINNINFYGSKITYTWIKPDDSRGGGIVNGFIGNRWDVTNTAGILGSIIDNSFNSINITVLGYSDSDYLAGGGIIGVRSTANSTEISQINGNYFNNIAITTGRSPLSTIGSGGAYLEGGGIIGVNGVSSPANTPGHAYLGVLYANVFNAITVKSSDMILGGGLVGVNNNSQNVSTQTFSQLGTVLKNIFGNGTANSIVVTADYSLRGGGVIGVNGLSNAGVVLNNLYENVFSGISVTAGTYLRGGGIVGVSNNNTEKHPDQTGPTTIPDKSISASMTNVIGNQFLLLNVNLIAGSKTSSSNGEFSGGGVLGVKSGPNAASLKYLFDNVFKSINVTSLNSAGITNIFGGGIVGVNSQWWSSIEGASGNYFDTINVTVSNGHLWGGGVIGLYSAGTSTINDGLALGSVLDSNYFYVLDIKANQGNIYGGGVIGATAVAGASVTQNQRQAGFTSVSSNIFGAGSTGTIEVTTKNLYGGGLIGAYAEGGTAFIKFINLNTFSDATGGIQINAENIYGGGIIGVTIDEKSTSSIASIEYLSSNLATSQHFKNIEVTTTKQLTGGGLVGAVALGNGAGSADANIKYIMSNDFESNKITVGSYLEGGGIIGVRSPNVASISSIYNSNFWDNVITVGTFIDGGGIIGVTGPLSSTSSKQFGISQIKDSWFNNNTVTAGGTIAGGLIYSYGLNTPLTIDGSQFSSNTFTSTTNKVYGTITIDTGLDKSNMVNRTNEVILYARPGTSCPSINPGCQYVVFKDNKIIENGATRYNSLYFGRVESLTSGGSANDYARSDALLTIQTESGSVVALYDPIYVNQDNEGVLPNRVFQMNVTGPGQFIWGGYNGYNEIKTGVITNATSQLSNSLNFYNGTNTYLEQAMELKAPNHTFYLYKGGNLHFHSGHKMTLESGYLYGSLHFTLDNTPVVADGFTHSSGSEILNIKSANPVNINGAVVYLYATSISDYLSPGDKFYLIDTNEPGGLIGDTYTKVAKVQYGYFSQYNFIIDKEGDPGTTNQQLVARLPKAAEPTPDPTVPPVDPTPDLPPTTPDVPPPSPDLPVPPATPDTPSTDPVDPSGPPSPVTPNPPTPTPTPDVSNIPPLTPAEDAKIVLEGRMAGLALLANIGNWLADHSYKSADMALKEGNPLTHHAPSSGDKDHGWAPYAGIDAGVFWTHKGSKNKYRTFTFIAGLTRQVYFPERQSSFLLSAFVDGGFASYDVTTNYGTFYGPKIDGDGSLRYLGGGLMARQRWDNGFRLEASARAGKMENKFTALNYVSSQGDPLDYTVETPYYALHFGVGHEWMLTDDSTLDLLLRYFWTKQDAKSLRLKTGEKVEYDKNISQRFRIGSRYTKIKSERFSYYLGASYEREFDTKSRGYLTGVGPFDIPSLKGGTGIGEIGIIYRSTEDRHFNIETGIQGHVGVRRGISGGVRIGWEF